jgi:hypothetical protein
MSWCICAVIFILLISFKWWIFGAFFAVIITAIEFFSDGDVLIEIDEAKGTVKLRKEELHRSDICRIRISELESGGYIYDYLQLIGPDEHIWRVLRVNVAPLFSRESESQRIAKLIAEKLGFTIVRK